MHTDELLNVVPNSTLANYLYAIAHPKEVGHDHKVLGLQKLNHSSRMYKELLRY